MSVTANVHGFLKRWLVPACLFIRIFQIQVSPDMLGEPAYWIYRAARYAVPALLLIHIVFFQRNSRRQLALIFLITAVFGLSAVKSGVYSVVMIWLLIAAARGQDTDELVRAGYWAMLSSAILIVTAFFLGRIEENATVREATGLLRHSWGYSHPNILGAVVLQLSACRLYLHRDRLGVEDILITAGAAAFAYAVPNSQSSAICIALLLVLALLYLVWPKLPRKLRTPLLNCFVPAAAFCNLFIVICSLCYRPGGPLEPVNRLLTTRLFCANTIYSIYGVSLFGNRLATMYTYAEHNGIHFWMPWLDSSYLNLLIRYGLLTYLVYSALYLLGMLRARKAGNLMLLGILAIYAAHAVMEPSMYDLKQSFFAVLLLSALPSGDECENPSHNFTGT